MEEQQAQGSPVMHLLAKRASLLTTHEEMTVFSQKIEGEKVGAN
jgi:hypothetical protein